MSAMQNINLYQPANPRLASFTARTSLLTLGIAALAMLLVWALGLWQVNRLEQRLPDLADLQSTRQVLNITTESGVMSTDPVQLMAQLQQLQQLSDSRKRSLAVLDARLTRNASFTPRLEALARRHLQGVWLDHIVLTNSQGVSSIGGGTVSVDLIPRYLQGLASETSLAGSAFNEFRIEGRYADAAEDKGDALPAGSYRFNASNRNESSENTGNDAAGTAG